MEAMLGYAGSVGTALWYEIAVVLIEILNTLWSLSGFANFFYPGPFQQAIGGEAC
jgi:hypothetical protein